MFAPQIKMIKYFTLDGEFKENKQFHEISDLSKIMAQEGCGKTIIIKRELFIDMVYLIYFIFYSNNLLLCILKTRCIYSNILWSCFVKKY